MAPHFMLPETKASGAKVPKHEWFLVRLLILVKLSHSKYSFEIVVYSFHPFCQKSAIPDRYCLVLLLLIIAELMAPDHLYL